MSTVIMSACWPLQMQPSQKAVLISLADNANDAGVCWPAIATICTRTCLGKTAVIAAIKKLEEAGYIVADRSNGRRTTYQIDLSTLNQGALFEEVKPVREANRSAIRTGPGAGPNRSASRSKPVREADTNRKEPSLTARERAQVPAGTCLPLDWSPSDEDRAYARQHRPDLVVDAEAKKFAAFFRSAVGTKALSADWSATWQLWVMRAAASAQGQTAGTTAATSPAAPSKDWREPAESKLEREIAWIRQQHGYGVLGDGEAGEAERDRLIAEARQQHGEAAAA